MTGIKSWRGRELASKLEFYLEGALGEACNSWSFVEDYTCEFVQVLSSF